MLEALTMPFVQYALMAGLMVGLLSAYFGVFVVQRGLSFMGNGLAHAAFGGVALALLAGWDHYLWVAMPYTIAVGLGIQYVQRRTRMSGDTVIGIFFAVSMALGIIFLSLRRDTSVDAWAVLFGDILAITAGDVWMAGGALATGVAALPMWRRWAYATFDPELAQADRLRVERDDYLLAGFLALTIVVAVKVVGIVLIAALLVIPPATARLLAPTFLAMTLLSMVLGLAGVLAGMAAAWHFDLPTGPAIILVQAGFFFLAAIARRRG